MVEDSGDGDGSGTDDALRRLREWWARQTGVDAEDLSDAPKSEEEMRALGEPRDERRAPGDGPVGPSMPEPGGELGEGASIVHVDTDVDALFRGEIDKEEFDRRIAEREDGREDESVTYTPDDE